jgi:hypothetical protein
MFHQHLDLIRSMCIANKYGEGDIDRCHSRAKKYIDREGEKGGNVKKEELHTTEQTASLQNRHRI